VDALGVSTTRPPHTTTIPQVWERHNRQRLPQDWRARAVGAAGLLGCAALHLLPGIGSGATSPGQRCSRSAALH